MKYKLEKNLKILNELITYYNTKRSYDLHIDFHSTEKNFSFAISGYIDCLNKEEIHNLNITLNKPRQHEIEQTYWSLGGESEFESELTLVAMMIDKAVINYADNILTIEVERY